MIKKFFKPMEKEMCEEEKCKCHKHDEKHYEKCEELKNKKCCKNHAEEECANENSNAEIESEVTKLKDTVLRKVAEIENLRKRFEKEKDDTAKFAHTKFAKDLLPVLDNFEKVSSGAKNFKDADPAVIAFFDGVALCEKELLNVFKKHGIEKIEIKKGEIFNPNYHQVMLEEPSSEYAPGAITNVLQHGYVCNGRVLRASLVSISKQQG